MVIVAKLNRFIKVTISAVSVTKLLFGMYIHVRFELREIAPAYWLQLPGLYKYTVLDGILINILTI